MPYDAKYDPTYQAQKWEKRHSRIKSYSLAVIAVGTSIMATVQFMTATPPATRAKQEDSSLTTLWAAYENCITDSMREFPPTKAAKEKMQLSEYDKMIDDKCRPLKVAFEEAKRQR